LRWLGFIAPILVTLLVYIIIKVAIIGVGIGVGFVLNWLLPELNLSVAMLIGVIATGLSLHFFGRFLMFDNSFHSFRGSTVGPDDDDDLDDEDAQEIIDIISSLPPPRTPGSRRRRKRWPV
jgi:hypothetical protein